MSCSSSTLRVSTTIGAAFALVGAGGCATEPGPNTIIVVDGAGGGGGATGSGSGMPTSGGGLAGGGTCTPNCNGLECGLDPVCGQSCGACSAGTCEGGTCQLECTQEGATQCNGLDGVSVCSGGQWQSSACPALQVCVEGGCQPVCDGQLASASGPATCFFPVIDNGVATTYGYTTDAAKLELGNTVVGAVWDAAENDVPIVDATSGGWPWAWDMTETDQLLAGFFLDLYGGSASSAVLRYRARLSDQAAGVYGESFFADGALGSEHSSAATNAWTTQMWTVAGGGFSSSELNLFVVASKEIPGLGCTPQPCDGGGSPAGPIELSWFMVEVVP